MVDHLSDITDVFRLFIFRNSIHIQGTRIVLQGQQLQRNRRALTAGSMCILNCKSLTYFPVLVIILYYCIKKISILTLFFILILV